MQQIDISGKLIQSKFIECYSLINFRDGKDFLYFKVTSKKKDMLCDCYIPLKEIPSNRFITRKYLLRNNRIM